MSNSDKFDILAEVRSTKGILPEAFIKAINGFTVDFELSFSSRLIEASWGVGTPAVTGGRNIWLNLRKSKVLSGGC